MQWKFLFTLIGLVQVQNGVVHCQESSFTCPEEFGYFPHPSDCSQYYVCVFGGALLESCTGGLMYSHELQTCDWPRNVKQPCNATSSAATGVSNNEIQVQPLSGGGGGSVRDRSQRVRGTTTTEQSNQYAYKPIKIENYEEISAIANVNEDQFTNGRNSRSYEQAVPNYKEYNGKTQTLQGRDRQLLPTHSRTKRHLTIFNMFMDKIRQNKKPTSPTSKKPKLFINKKSSHFPHTSGPNPGSIMYPPSYYNTQQSYNPSHHPFLHSHHNNHHTHSIHPHSHPFTPNQSPKPTYGAILHPLDLKTTKRPDFHKYLSMSSTSTTTPRPLTPPTQSAVKLNFHSHPSNPSYSVNRPVLIKASQMNKVTLSPNVLRPSLPAVTTRQPPAIFTNPPTRKPSTTKKPKINDKHSDDYYYYDDGGNLSGGGSSTSGGSVSSSIEDNTSLYNDNPRDKNHKNKNTSKSKGGYTFLDIRNEPTNPPKPLLQTRPDILNINKYNNNNNNNNRHNTNKHNSNSNENSNNSGHRSVHGNGYTVNNPSSAKKYAQQSYAAPPPQQQQQQPELDQYSNLRYAAQVPVNNTASYVYKEDPDDSSYYVYDDNSSANYDDVDYKTYAGNNYAQTTARTTTTTTRRPRTTKAPVVQKTRNNRRPTNKPKSQLKVESVPVRDVYLDAPSRPQPVYESPVVNTPAQKCRRDTCVLPDCNCGGKDIPGGLRPEETPQIVLLTFDDSVNDLNKNLYRDLFEKGRKNPNGCPISATFYVSHEWTDYSQVQNLAADGHEIASHSVSHSFGESFSQKKWTTEINGQREILAAYGGVKLSEVRGMRAPFLAIGGNNMFKMLHDANFTYDSSMPIYENRPPSWPYTLDYKIFHDCMIPPCPTKSYPGVWEVPMVMWQDLKGGRCSMGDACSNPPTAEGVYQMLAKNFERHYTTNRAPFGLYYHAAWFTQAHHKEGFEAFLDTLVSMDDVWIVTNWQGLQWIRSPTPSSRINSFEPFNNCRNNNDRPPRCNHPRVCNLWHKSGVRYMKTCQTCPQQYPWTGNTGVPYTI